MGKIEEAKQILKELGLPPKQQNERSALTLLALCYLKEESKWSSAKAKCMSVVGNKNNPRYEGIMRFIADNYNIKYAENSRETFRRQTLHQFVQAGLVLHNPDNPDLPTNSKNNHYRLTSETLSLIKKFKSKDWCNEVKKFSMKLDSIKSKYQKKREQRKIPVVLENGTELQFSPGKHNKLQIAVLELFAPRFAPGSVLLYVGDTARKNLYLNKRKLKTLGAHIDEHSKLPDVILYVESKKWLYLIEAVTSHGPISPKRIIEMEELFKDCNLGKIYVTAFPNLQEFKRHMNDIAWETEVWIQDNPDHMVHFNGDKFLGPR